METVDEARAKYGLKSLGDLRAAGALKDILTQQKEETVDALSVVARPVEVSSTHLRRRSVLCWYSVFLRVARETVAGRQAALLRFSAALCICEGR